MTKNAKLSVMINKKKVQVDLHLDLTQNDVDRRGS